MSPNIRIAIRFLTANKRSMAMSLAGIVFGVGFFIFGQAQTSGFEKFFVETILGTDGAIRVQDRIRETFTTMELENEGGSSWVIENTENFKYIEGIENPLEVIEALKKFGSVTGISEVLTGSVTIGTSFRDYTGRLFGVKIDDHVAVSNLENQIIFGSLNDFRSKPTGILIGSGLARRLQVGIGETVIVTSRGLNFRYTIAAIFETGVSDIDRERFYMNLTEARSVLQRPHGASFLQVNLVDPDRAQSEALHMMNTIYYHVASWQEREKSWLTVFFVIRFSTGLTISTIILLSGLGMFNTLAMLVLEKTKEIAILRSMGYTRNDISSIFLWQGVFVLIIGTSLGCILAILITFGVSKLPFRVTGIFTTDSFLVKWSIWHYVSAVATASVVVLIASYIPARRAARLEPGDIIRGYFPMSETHSSSEEKQNVVLRCENLHRYLGEGEGRVHVLRGVSVELNRGKVYAIVGPSGCGKSTLLYLLGLLDKPDDGEIYLANQAMTTTDDQIRTAARNAHLGFVFQFHFLLKEFSALDNVMIPMRKHGTLTQPEMEAKARGYLEDVGLGDKLERLATQLSGGEQQRVAIARSLANTPSVILADEPTGNLDVQNSNIVIDLLTRLARENDQAVLIVTHNHEVAEKCDHILTMQDGLFLN